MGRRILADLVKGDIRRRMVTRPNAAAKVLKIPEPNADNDGPTGFFGVADFVRSRQELEVEISESGDYVGYQLDDGGRFTITPDHVRDGDGDDVVDVINPMGGERENIPVYTQVLLGVDVEYQLSSPKMIQLRRWGKATTSQGVVGMMAVCRWTGSGNRPSIMIWTMDEYEDHGGSPMLSYQWDYKADKGFTTSDTSSEVPGCDLVELDDGSIVCAVSLDNSVEIHKSFDCGENWMLIATVATVASEPWSVAVDRVGTRLVVVYARAAGAGSVNRIYSRYSDNGGVSWSEEIVVDVSDGAVAITDIDLCVGLDNVLYLLYLEDDSGTDRPTYRSTVDGANWTGEVTWTTNGAPDGGLTFLQRYFGAWVQYHIESTVGYGSVIEFHGEGATAPVDADTPMVWSSYGYVEQNGGDSDGADFEQLCAREFMDGGFVDLVVMHHDDHDSPNEYWNLVVYRLAMWSGIQFDEDIMVGVPVVATWTPHVYPSTNDPHPNLNVWTRAQAGTGAIANDEENDFRHMEITAADGVSDLSYRYPAAGQSGAWDDGLTARFELKVVSGYPKVYLRLTSGAGVSNKDVQVTVQFSTSEILLYDEIASAEVDSVTPVNWDPENWNEYVVIAKENEIKVFRAPSGVYREVAPYEEILTYDALQEAVWSSNDDRVKWGIMQGYGSDDAATESHWRSFFAYDLAAFDVAWDFTEERGKKCYWNPVGIMQGVGCKWDGDFAVDGDSWELDVGAHYDADNILLASPRLRWAEPVRDPFAAASEDAEFEWQREDPDGVCMNMPFNAIAIFGMNHFYWNLYGQGFGGGGDVSLLSCFGDTLGNVIYAGSGATSYGLFEVDSGYPDQNVVKVVANTAVWDGEFIPNQFASDDYRNWYVCFSSGTKDSCIYKIMANTEDTLFLERNVESDGVADGDNLLIFADRCLCLLPATYMYSRVRFRYRVNGFTPSPGDKQFRLGTVVLGMLHDLPDDEWEFSVRTEPAVEVEQGRGQFRQVSELGPERRLIDLAYTGTRDKGMGVHSTKELYRFLRWGVHPVVWIDDDVVFSALTPGTGDQYGHVDPILARVRGPVTQQHKAYEYVQEDGVWRVRNYLDMQGVTLEEVL